MRRKPSSICRHSSGPKSGGNIARQIGHRLADGFAIDQPIDIVGQLGPLERVARAGPHRHADADEAAGHRDRHAPGLRSEINRCRAEGLWSLCGLRRPHSGELDAHHRRVIEQAALQPMIGRGLDRGVIKTADPGGEVGGGRAVVGQRLAVARNPMLWFQRPVNARGPQPGHAPFTFLRPCLLVEARD